MTARHDDLRASNAVFHGDHVGAEAVANVVIFHGDSFALEAIRKDVHGFQAKNELPLWNVWLK